jgi:hypothetical protein
MAAAVLAALAVWCAVPPSPRARARRILLRPAAPRRLAPAMAAAMLAPAAGIVVLGWTWGPLVGLALAPLVHRSVSRLESTASRRRAARIEAALPTALDLMVAALTVGRPPVTAFALAAEATSDPLAADPEIVWRGLAADPALAPVGRAFRRAASSGMPVADIVAGVADELRRERSARLRELGQRVGVRTAAPLGLCFLPAFFLIGIVPPLVASFGSFAW